MLDANRRIKQCLYQSLTDVQRMSVLIDGRVPVLTRHTPVKIADVNWIPMFIAYGRTVRKVRKVRYEQRWCQFLSHASFYPMPSFITCRMFFPLPHSVTRSFLISSIVPL